MRNHTKFSLKNFRKGFRSVIAQFFWVISSAVEHLVYTERVGGSIPSSPTIFLFITLALSACGKAGKPEPVMGDTLEPRTYPSR